MKQEVWIDDDEIVVKKDVFEDRLTKQRVKEAIEKYITFIDDNYYNGVHQELNCDEHELKELFEELGLGDEGVTEVKTSLMLCKGCKNFFNAFENDCKCGYTNIDENGMVIEWKKK